MSPNPPFLYPHASLPGSHQGMLDANPNTRPSHERLLENVFFRESEGKQQEQEKQGEEDDKGRPETGAGLTASSST
ncbi:hypothetical protein BGX29_000439 [Mortierella sp. GBA35]|nr:hypothetical protein BGX29_000439 [Mortierella sp. GBA35]